MHYQAKFYRFKESSTVCEELEKGDLDFQFRAI